MIKLENLYQDVYLDEKGRPAFDELIIAVTKQRDSFSEQALVPQDIVNLMKQAGFFRSTVPACFGGNAGNPLPFLLSIEKLSSIDGSTGWVGSFGSSNYYLAALPVETQAKIYADGPDQMFAGGLFPVQPAQRKENGWIVNGRWKFSSGCKTADWIGVGISEAAKDGFNDKPRSVILPASQVDIIDSWDAMGMEGTGSHDLSVTDQYVTEDWSFIRGAEATIDELMYKIPTVALSGQVHTAVSLGLASAALLELVKICKGATTTGAPSLADRAYFRIGLAKATAEYFSARSYFYDIAEEVWHTLESGSEVSTDLTNEMRLSATHAAQTSAQVVERCYRIAGINSIFKTARIQKILRDAMVITQHAHINESVFDGAGAVMTGVEPFRGYI